MPLSEHEQRLLEQIEQGLYAEDPKFASTVRKARTNSFRRRRLLFAVVGIVAGLAMVLIGLITKLIPVSVVGFVIIVGAIAFVVSSSLRKSDSLAGPLGVVDPSGATRARRQSGMKERM